MDIEKGGPSLVDCASVGQPSTSLMKRKRSLMATSDEAPPFDKTTSPMKLQQEKAHKQRKLVHKKPDTKDIPNARIVQVRFCADILQSVAAKILYKEPWGVMVLLLEGREDLGAEKGRRYWTKFSGVVHPVTNVPVLDAVHPC